MSTFKISQNFLSPTKHSLLQSKRRFSHSMICFSKSNNSDSGSSVPEGDTRTQDMLAKIAILQTQKMRLTDYLDERSAYLTQFAEDANADFDKIGEDAMRGLDQATARIMEKIENQMQAFEESAEINKQEIHKSENNLVEFESQIEKDRNEGMFFKSLGERKTVDKIKAKEEMHKIKKLMKESAQSKTRRNIYLALLGVLTIGILNSIYNSAGWEKVAVLGVILVALFSQLYYEQKLIAEVEEWEQAETEKQVNIYARALKLPFQYYSLIGSK